MKQTGKLSDDDHTVYLLAYQHEDSQWLIASKILADITTLTLCQPWRMEEGTLFLMPVPEICYFLKKPQIVLDDDC